MFILENSNFPCFIVMKPSFIFSFLLFCLNIILFYMLLYVVCDFWIRELLATGLERCQSLSGLLPIVASKFNNAEHHWFEVLLVLFKPFFTLPIKLIEYKFDADCFFCFLNRRKIHNLTTYCLSSSYVNTQLYILKYRPGHTEPIFILMTFMWLITL